jgi:hypothetical protein
MAETKRTLFRRERASDENNEAREHDDVSVVGFSPVVTFNNNSGSRLKKFDLSCTTEKRLNSILFFAAALIISLQRRTKVCCEQLDN